MPRSPLPASLVLCLAALTACRSKEPAHPATPEADLLRVTASDYAFEAPDSISAGVTTIRLINKGPSLHHVQLVRLDQGKTLPDFLEALKGGGPPPGWATLIGGPNSPVPGDSTTAVFPLDPGTYAIICLIPAADGMPHVAKGMAHGLTVTGPARVTAEPSSDLTIRLLDYDFQLSAPLTAGHHTIRLENGGQQWHELVLVKLLPGRTAMDFASWAEKMVGDAPGEMHGGISGILPGAHGSIVTDLAPGSYGLLCFFPDVKDGKPHVAHGMVKTFTVN